LTLIVDALGTWCPVPLRLLEAALANSGGESEAELLADDPLIAVDLPAWCHRRGAELLTLDEGEDGVFRALVRDVKFARDKGNVRRT
jgi:tRNA 2-thiouridine synthesizing protein A